MHQQTVRNVEAAFIEGLWWLKAAGIKEDSRNGKVIVSPEPVATVYTHPWERVLLNPARDANPFFHLAECIWMLAGSDDLGWIVQFNSRMKEYSDNGVTLHGAYGARWRSHFAFDQVHEVIGMLRNDPTTRRAVIAMWDANEDLAPKKDLPCNTHIYLRVMDGKLHMTVCCRSNDIVWGAFGANAVHFSFLHEFIARALDLGMGTITQFSNNFHIYERHWGWVDIPPISDTKYAYPSGLSMFPILGQADEYNTFLKECADWVYDGREPQKCAFLTQVAWPMLEYHRSRKIGYPLRHLLQNMPDVDWKVAALDWVDRRDNASK